MKVTAGECPICDRVALWREGRNDFLIEEFEQSIFVVGDHQFFAGYSLLLLKEHVRELHELTRPAQQALFRELMIATDALVRAYRPWKMNHACYGNLVPHTHWHLIPRYESDPDRASQPWLHAGEFDNYLIGPEEARAVGEKIRRHLYDARLN
jgi:diadenosine tetraphosphate (Ap4A) HIT family hydrolase